MCGQTDPAWLKLLFVVLPVVAAFIGVVLTNKNNRKINRESHKLELARLNRSAIEQHGSELYGLLESWSDELVKACTRVWIYTREGERPPQAALETIRESSRVLHARFLVGVYFNDLSSLMGRVGMLYIELGDQARKAIQDEHVIGEAASDTEMGEAEKAFRQAVLQLEQAVIATVRSSVLSGPGTR
jgi:hypothetical protein